MMDGDIAVIEYIDYLGKWAALCYIGPDRSGGVIGEYDSSRYRADELRIRYLNRPDEK